MGIFSGFLTGQINSSGSYFYSDGARFEAWPNYQVFRLTYFIDFVSPAGK
jgi:hypothetical protein